MHHSKDKHFVILDAIDDHIVPGGETAVCEAKIPIPRTSDIGKAAKRQKRWVMLSIRRSATSMLLLTFAT